MPLFQLVSEFKPTGDQPKAIAELASPRPWRKCAGAVIEPSLLATAGHRRLDAAKEHSSRRTDPKRRHTAAGAAATRRSFARR